VPPGNAGCARCWAGVVRSSSIGCTLFNVAGSEDGSEGVKGKVDGGGSVVAGCCCATVADAVAKTPSAPNKILRMASVHRGAFDQSDHLPGVYILKRVDSQKKGRHSRPRCRSSQAAAEYSAFAVPAGSRKPLNALAAYAKRNRDLASPRRGLAVFDCVLVRGIIPALRDKV
jgi:hypothetical protein